MSANRIVVVLTPVFSALAGSLAAWAADNVPGSPQMDEAALTGVFIAGALSGAGAAAQWLRGWQKHEAARERRAERFVAGLPLTRMRADEAPVDNEPLSLRERAAFWLLR